MAAMYETAQVGKRQEILDRIFNVEAEETPFISMLASGPTPNQMLASWVGEVYPDVASTGVLDGAAASTPAKVDRYLLQGTAQHFRQQWGVTTLANLTNAAGVGRNEAGHQMMLAMMLLKRQMEQQFLSDDDCTIESGATPWTARGAFKWLDSSAQSQYPVPTQLLPSSSTKYVSALASLTQDSFRGLLQAAYAARKGAVDLVGLVDVGLKAVIDDWTTIYPVASTSSQPRMTYAGGDPAVLKNFVDELHFSVGRAKIGLSSFLNRTTSTGAAATVSGNGVFLDLRMWQLCYLQKPANTNLAADGSGKKGFVDAVAIVKCLNPLGQCKVQCAS